LLLLSDHMRKHYFNRLIWFLDFILTYKKPGIDYKNIIETAEKLNLKKSLDYTLFTIQKYFPNQIEERTINLSYLERKIIVGIIQEKIKKGNTYLYFFSLKNPINKLHLILKKIFPGTGDMRYIYNTDNKFKLFIFSFLRPIFILITFLQNLSKVWGKR
ncbi:hypothetical protein KAU33_16385, partial [Candidatus Dependentiae bacterium]|nr:hypothetical protein [Candidatus Dependentiae bacterium]